jgi:hypothetical protein
MTLTRNGATGFSIPVTKLAFDIDPLIKAWLIAAGFVNVQERKICSAVGKWSKDPWEREVGMWNQLRLVRGVVIKSSAPTPDAVRLQSTAPLSSKSLLQPLNVFAIELSRCIAWKM